MLLNERKSRSLSWEVSCILSRPSSINLNPRNVMLKKGRSKLRYAEESVPLKQEVERRWQRLQDETKRLRSDKHEDHTAINDLRIKLQTSEDTLRMRTQRYEEKVEDLQSCLQTSGEREDELKRYNEVECKHKRNNVMLQQELSSLLLKAQEQMDQDEIGRL
eukprot:746016-Hanusia_phi.AAC.2